MYLIKTLSTNDMISPFGLRATLQKLAPENSWNLFEVELTYCIEFPLHKNYLQYLNPEYYAIF